MILQDVQHLFPVTNPRAKGAATGHIPMEFVNANLEDFKRIVKHNGLRRIYIGPRYDRVRAYTLKEDARAMVLYPDTRIGGWREMFNS